MVINTFTYYNHLKELDKYLLTEKFIDGETYEVHFTGDLYRIEGNFIVNIMAEELGKWRYRDVIRNQSVPLYHGNIRLFIKTIQSLKFKQIK